MSVTNYAFWLFIISLGIYVFLLSLVARRLRVLGSAHDDHAEALDQLILFSGSRVGKQLDGLKYILAQKYLGAQDAKLSKLGCYARLGFFVTFWLMIIWMVLILLPVQPILARIGS